MHRDLKSPNLLVDQHFNVKIAGTHLFTEWKRTYVLSWRTIDFGLARIKASLMTSNLGTCQYMAPGSSLFSFFSFFSVPHLSTTIQRSYQVSPILKKQIFIGRNSILYSFFSLTLHSQQLNTHTLTHHTKASAWSSGKCLHDRSRTRACSPCRSPTVSCTRTCAHRCRSRRIPGWRAWWPRVGTRILRSAPRSRMCSTCSSPSNSNHLAKKKKEKKILGTPQICKTQK